ncbi:MAG: AbrB/MazE/SpoVT family DNA-binding domain-containing protein [Thaumarchaeota archaeon]|nr:AbrB/MazE/SpoVT family DNA-binding domain-containing protein [Nitrososphaerota archaeon]
MSTTVKLSRKNQIVIPKEARKKLSLSPGDELVVEVELDRVVMKPKPKSYTEYALGLHKKVWKGVETERYLEEERESWKEKD